MSSLRNLSRFVLVGAALSVLYVSRAHAEPGPDLWFVAGAESSRPLGLEPGKPVTLSFFWRIEPVGMDSSKVSAFFISGSNSLILQPHPDASPDELRGTLSVNVSGFYTLHVSLYPAVSPDQAPEA